MFQKGMKGTLMRIEEAAETRYKYEIWFDYTRQAMTTISEGAMVAVANFASTREERHYSILEIASLLPVHYALGNDISGYPGFVMEAAKSAGQDWVSQEREATDETTKIKCIAIPTNIEWIERHGVTEVIRKDFQQESSIPMVGHDALPLDSEATSIVANLNIDEAHDKVTNIGTLVRDDDVPALLKVDELVRLHYGIFGFTGAGKSNLLSTLVASVLSVEEFPCKVVIFDLLGEFSTLLIDQLCSMKAAAILNLGLQTVPEAVADYYRDPERPPAKLQVASKAYARTSVCPRPLLALNDEREEAFSRLLIARKTRFLALPPPSMRDILIECKEVIKGNMGNDGRAVDSLLRSLKDKYGQKSVADALKDCVSECERLLETLTVRTAQQNMEQVVSKLKEYDRAEQQELPTDVLFSFDDVKKVLNDETKSCLLIIQSHDPDELRSLSLRLVNSMFGNRRLSGRTGPPVTFLFDEADEFIPRQADKDSSHAKSRAAATTLARRGRKFGLGLGIATQRIAHLDASILAQPHTYFVSKLPRQYDRQAVSEAFGFTEENFRQTFKFKKGDWLLASYDAAGLEAVPIPIHCPDANERIRRFLLSLNKDTDKQFELQSP
ncbi:MAG: ATP-binding protein [Fimbriimonadales bacterium]|nr:ATP-binding protein [Fimbriimonadales bacterium]